TTCLPSRASSAARSTAARERSTTRCAAPPRARSPARSARPSCRKITSFPVFSTARWWRSSRRKWPAPPIARASRGASGGLRGGAAQRRLSGEVPAAPLPHGRLDPLDRPADVVLHDLEAIAGRVCLARKALAAADEKWKRGLRARCAQVPDGASQRLAS